MAGMVRLHCQHIFNPLHVFCRLRSFGLSKPKAKRAARWYELKIYKREVLTMAETKSILKSTTIKGALVTILGGFFALLQLDWNQPIVDLLQQNMEIIGGSLAAILGGVAAIYGRMRKDIKPLLGVLLLVCLLPVASGCSARQVTTASGQTVETPAYVYALQTGQALQLAWKAAHEECARLREALPERRAYIDENIAPAIDKAKAAIILVRDASESWARTQVQPVDWGRLLADATQAWADAMTLWNTFTQEVQP